MYPQQLTDRLLKNKKFKIVHSTTFLLILDITKLADNPVCEIKNVLLNCTLNNNEKWPSIQVTDKPTKKSL